jgi:uncharacterized protein (TIGR00159 family)
VQLFAFFQQFVNNFRWVDLFDILIVATLIYLALIWFEKTRARFVLIGIMILGAVYTLARLLGLYLTTTAFQTFFAVFLVALVVIFQEELRRFFERVALWGIFPQQKKKARVFAKEIETLVRVANSLAQKHIGALMVIKGRDALERHLEGGVLLDGRLSDALLESIFDPHSQGHDGAVVIDQDRVIKFACQLPLSVNFQKLGNLGTRHAAALGLTERSDSLCVVISEERGKISLTDGESLLELKEADALKTALEQFYNQRFPAPSPRLSLASIMRNFWEKLLALVLAFGFWFIFAYQSDVVRRDFVVPIEYRNLAPNWLIKEPKPKEAAVTFSGSGKAFDLLDHQSLKISLDLSKIAEGKHEIILSKELVRYPTGLSVVSISPRKIIFESVRLTSFALPIEVKTIGEPPQGIRIRRIQVLPSSVMVIASPEVKADKTKILTEAVDLQKISDSQTLIAKLVIPSDIRFYEGKPPDVRIVVEVEKRLP